MSKNVIAFAGHKESGKDSATRFVYGMSMLKAGVIEEFQIGERGELFVPVSIKDEQPEEQMFGEFKIDPYLDPDLAIYLATVIWPHARKIALADPLKEFAMDYLGLPANLLWGTNEDKETVTTYKKSKLPLYTAFDLFYHNGSNTEVMMDLENEPFLTIREVLQLVGTELFRKIDPEYWLNKNRELIKEDSSKLVIVSDVRFENEIVGLRKDGVIVIYLTRNIHGNKDGHSSEKDVDKLRNLADFCIDNDKLTIEETHEILEKFLVDKGIL